MRAKSLLFVAVLALLAAPGAFADTLYTSSATWTAAVGAPNVISLVSDFNTLAGGLSGFNTGVGTSTIQGGVTFTADANIYAVGPNSVVCCTIATATGASLFEDSTASGTAFTITPLAGTYGVSFLSANGCIPNCGIDDSGTVTVTLADGTTDTYSGADGTFFGVTSGVAITSITVSSAANGAGFNSAILADFMYSQTPLTTAPEPSSLLLLACGLAGLGLLLKRQRRLATI